ncbi:hypothetical protein SASPL_145408 [Salvia splendens]|uniref:Branched-chain amino acid aminotransferase n=1 Tax=Salvia splendens TaxID=180675 RepID=A0A8X8WIG1_SALSN|nr:hypothetical protein SASPL_145408 [Salvia splendens]
MTFELSFRWESGPKTHLMASGLPIGIRMSHKSTSLSYRMSIPLHFPSSMYNLLEQSLPLYNLLRFQYLTQLSKVEMEFGRVFEFITAKLFDSAKALALVMYQLVSRLTLTRGKKVTSGMSPSFNQYGCTLIVLAEWKPPVYDNEKGIVLVTATTRRNSPNIEGNNAHADDAIMLDKDGYVSETNATNIFLVKKGCVATPYSDYCLPGVTRATVMDLAVNENLVMVERRIGLSEFHTADEVFTTGTMGELSPVSYILRYLMLRNIVINVG